MESVQVPSCLRQGSKDTALCAKKLPPLNGSMVLSVSVARIFGEIWNRGFPNFSTAVDDRGLYRLIPFFSTGDDELSPSIALFSTPKMSSLGTGSETLSRMLESTGLNLHDHQCNAHTCLCVELIVEKKLVATKTVIPNPSRNNDVQLIF